MQASSNRPPLLRLLWRAYGYLRPYSRTVVLTYLCVFAILGLNLTVPQFIRWIIDRGIAQGNLRLLGLSVVALLGITLVRGIFSYFEGTLSERASQHVAYDLRNAIQNKLTVLSFSFHDQSETGELLSRAIQDVERIRFLTGRAAVRIVDGGLMLVGTALVLIWMNPKLGALVVLTMPLLVLQAVRFGSRYRPLSLKLQRQIAALTTVIEQNLRGSRVVKAFARQDYEKNKFEKDNWGKYLKGKILLFMHSMFWPLSDIVLGFQMLFGFVYAANMAINGEITVGMYIAYVGLVVWLIWPIRNLGRIIVSASTGMVSYSRLMEVVKQAREPLHDGKHQSAGPVRGDLIFENVSFMYSDGKSDALKNISFHVKPGQAIALLGSTGSGKTSLVNLLPRFHEYTGGRILLDGVELKDYSREYLRRQIGIVEQEPFLFSRSIRENITYGVGRNVSDEEVERAAKAAAVHDVILTFPDGYNTLVGEKGVTLSGGQKQRVTIARTLLKNPRILILDDSTSSVDTETEAEIRDALNELMENRTTFIIAHRIQSVMIADLILVMDKGEVVQMGTHEELITQMDGMYRRIYDIQTRIDEELEVELSRMN